MKELLTPKQVATSLGVSESSLKRWCDRGVIATERTPGGHRRIRVGEVVRFLREQERPLVDPESIGLPTRSKMKVRSAKRSREALDHALRAGELELARRIFTELYLAGHTLLEVCEDLLVPVLHGLGDAWECGDVDVYEEHRASVMVSRLLNELRTLLPPTPPRAPLAFGCAPSGDLYTLPSLLVELVLSEVGFNAQSFGNSLPFESLERAIQNHAPAVVWLSVSAPCSSASVQRFLGAVPTSTRVLVGGQQADPLWAAGAANAVYCVTLSEVPGAVADLSPPRGAEARQP